MSRFLPPRIVADTVEKPQFWNYLKQLITEECAAVEGAFRP